MGINLEAIFWHIKITLTPTMPHTQFSQNQRQCKINALLIIFQGLLAFAKNRPSLQLFLAIKVSNILSNAKKQNLNFLTKPKNHNLKLLLLKKFQNSKSCQGINLYDLHRKLQLSNKFKFFIYLHHLLSIFYLIEALLKSLKFLVKLANTIFFFLLCQIIRLLLIIEETMSFMNNFYDNDEFLNCNCNLIPYFSQRKGQFSDYTSSSPRSISVSRVSGTFGSKSRAKNAKISLANGNSKTLSRQGTSSTYSNTPYRIIEDDEYTLINELR